jgi:hypothetical protein
VTIPGLSFSVPSVSHKLWITPRMASGPPAGPSPIPETEFSREIRADPPHDTMNRREGGASLSPLWIKSAEGEGMASSRPAWDRRPYAGIVRGGQTSAPRPAGFAGILQVDGYGAYKAASMFARWRVAVLSCSPPTGRRTAESDRAAWAQFYQRGRPTVGRSSEREKSETWNTR